MPRGNEKSRKSPMKEPASGSSANVPKPSGSSANVSKSINRCTDCKTDLNSKCKSIACDFCNSWYCVACSKLKLSIFEEIGKLPNVLWTCNHCTIALPGLKNILNKLSSFESRFEKLEEQIQKSAPSGPSTVNRESEPRESEPNIREIIHNELQEEREIEKRKYNVLVHGLPESTKESMESKKDDDSNRIMSILNDELHTDVEIFETQRLGILFDGRLKVRPVRFVVRDFEAKRKVLDAARRLKGHQSHSRLFFTPDLTRIQREDAFKLREEKRRREKEGENDLIIRMGRIVKASDQRPIGGTRFEHSYGRTQHQGQGMGGTVSSAGGGNATFRQ